MATNITSSDVFRFKGVELHGILIAWEIVAAMRVASHEYLKRNGGECEPQGAKQKQLTFRCLLQGAEQVKRLRALMEDWEREPRGQLIHPRLGRLNVCYESLRASEDPATAVDEISFQVTFLEDQADQAVSGARQSSPQQQAALVTSSSDSLTQSTALRFADTVNAVLILVDTAARRLADTTQRFVVAALEAAQNTAPDVALEALLGRVQLQRDAFLTALQASLAQTLESEVSLTGYRTDAYLVFARSVDLYNAVLAQRPPVIDWTVPATMAVTQILVQLYGKDARGKVDEFYLLNRVPNPYAVLGGTKLRVSAPVVRA